MVAILIGLIAAAPLAGQRSLALLRPVVGITPSRKLQTAGLFAYTATSTIDEVVKVPKTRK
jgi:hypothetical protein